MRFLEHAGIMTLALLPVLSSAGSKPTVREITTLNEQYAVGGVEFSADGSQLIALLGAYSRDAHVWAWRDGKQVTTLPNSYAPPLVGFPSRSSPDGKYWAHCGYGVTIWNARTWQSVIHLAGTLGENWPNRDGLPCKAIAFSADARTMIVLQAPTPMRSKLPSIIAYDTHDWKPRWSLTTTPFYVKSLAYSPDGRTVAVGGQVQNVKSAVDHVDIPTFGEPPLPDTGLVALVDSKSGTISQTIRIASSYYASHDVAWHRGGKAIAFAGDATLQSYEILTAAPQHVVWAENKSARPRLFVSPNGKYWIETGFGAKEEIVRVVDVSGASPDILHEIRAKPSHVAWAPDSEHFALAGAAPSIASGSPWLELAVPNSGRVIVYEIR
jgi:WD40 repeat protein